MAAANENIHELFLREFGCEWSPALSAWLKRVLNDDLRKRSDEAIRKFHELQDALNALGEGTVLTTSNLEPGIKWRAEARENGWECAGQAPEIDENYMRVHARPESVTLVLGTGATEATEQTITRRSLISLICEHGMLCRCGELPVTVGPPVVEYLGDLPEPRHAHRRPCKVGVDPETLTLGDRTALRCVKNVTNEAIAAVYLLLTSTGHVSAKRLRLETDNVRKDRKDMGLSRPRGRPSSRPTRRRPQGLKSEFVQNLRAVAKKQK